MIAVTEMTCFKLDVDICNALFSALVFSTSLAGLVLKIADIPVESSLHSKTSKLLDLGFCGFTSI